jgi:ribosomal protein L29
LVQSRAKLKQELHGLKMKHAIKWLKQTHLIKKARKDVARVNTLLTSKIKEKYGNSMN